jgi:hypothetical protein
MIRPDEGQPFRATVPIAAVLGARELASKEPWNYAWRALPDGSLEVAHIADRRNQLHILRPGTPGAELVARSDRQSEASRALELCIYAAFFSVVLIFWIAWWFVFVVAGFAALGFLGSRLDVRPPLRDWLRARDGTLDGWVRMPRVIGDLPATGNQLLELCALAESNRNVIVYRVLPRGTVEVPLERDGVYAIEWVEQSGSRRHARATEIRGISKRQLRKHEGNDPKWQDLRTDEPPSD